MSLFALIREYIAALREQTAATRAATAVQERLARDAAWLRHQEQWICPERHHHHEPHHGGNASIAGGCL